MTPGSDEPMFSRRVALLVPVPLLVAPRLRPEESAEIRIDVGSADGVPFRREDMGIVGVYDVDLLLRPEFGRMLDIFAASPGAISGVRFFGIFTAGEPEMFKPEGGGTVWVDGAGPMDFSIPFAALEALTSRGLTPFISLGFFPAAISDSPNAPPSDLTSWKLLVSAFLDDLASDPRFGAEAIATWWFEVWNEPNEGRFWSGTDEEYFALYRATSEAVTETGLAIRLGGPAIAYQPQADPDDGEPWMERFLQFIAADPELRCDFVSFHRKGTVGDDPPDPRRLHEAAERTRAQMLAIDPVRFADVPVINNEADEKVGFEVPYAPRMDERNASWLAAVASIQGELAAVEPGARFMAAADNANLQLVQEPFDGRRSLLTYAQSGNDELIKLPAFGFYEMVRLLEGRQGTVVSGGEQFYPATDLYHLTVAGEGQSGTLLTWYPHPDQPATGVREVNLRIQGIPGDRVRVTVFGIDGSHSIAYAAAGGSGRDPFPKPDRDQLADIRTAQELAVFSTDIVQDSWDGTISLRPYATVLVWIARPGEEVPAPPAWFTVEQLADRTELRWEPSRDPEFYTYEVERSVDGWPAQRVSPEVLRSAIWTDGMVHEAVRYQVRTVSTSGEASTWVGS